MNNKGTTVALKKNKKKKLPHLTKLNLEQLEEVAGAPAGDGCPWCIFSQ